MKLIVRIFALTLILAAIFTMSSSARSSAMASATHSSVPGGGGPMPTCNPFSSPCTPIR